MLLAPPTNENIETIAQWLADENNHMWLDFGQGVQSLSSPMLRMMCKRSAHHVRVFFPDNQDDAPIGVVAFSDICPRFKTATLWYVLGDKRHAAHHYTSRAVAQLLRDDVVSLGLVSVQAWAVEINHASCKVLERNGFRLLGRRRKCHSIRGVAYDRLFYDILSEEIPGELRYELSATCSV